MSLSLHKNKTNTIQQEIFEAEYSLSIQKYLENDLTNKIQGELNPYKLDGYNLRVHYINMSIRQR